MIGVRFTQLYIRLPTIKEYWNTVSDGVFPALDMGRYMTRTRFWQINRSLQFAESECEEKQILMFIEILNQTFQDALTPGSSLTIDESMIASRHAELKGKKKIKRKPRPIGIEIKNLADSKSRINLVLEKNEDKVTMSQKEYHAELGATTACTLRLTKPYHTSGRVVYADSWFGSVKTCLELKKRGLHSTVVVKTAHKFYPKLLLQDKGDLAVGEHHSMLLKDSELLAVQYRDKKEKQLLSSCSTTLPGEPRIKISKRTKETTMIPRPRIFSEYCEAAGAIDIYNHFRTGSAGLEDTWKTMKPTMRQFAGLLGFVETNAYLAHKFFSSVAVEHGVFRKELANALLTNKLDKLNLNILSLRPRLGHLQDTEHTIEKLPKRQKCYSCSNRGAIRVENKTIWCCSCTGPVKPLCSPNTGRTCFTDHVKTGLFPKKVYRAIVK